MLCLTSEGEGAGAWGVGGGGGGEGETDVPNRPFITNKGSRIGFTMVGFTPSLNLKSSSSK